MLVLRASLARLGAHLLLRTSDLWAGVEAAAVGGWAAAAGELLGMLRAVPGRWTGRCGMSTVSRLRERAGEGAEGGAQGGGGGAGSSWGVGCMEAGLRGMDACVADGVLLSCVGVWYSVVACFNVQRACTRTGAVTTMQARAGGEGSCRDPLAQEGRPGAGMGPVIPCLCRTVGLPCPCTLPWVSAGNCCTRLHGTDEDQHTRDYMACTVPCDVHTVLGHAGIDTSLCRAMH